MAGFGRELTPGRLTAPCRSRDPVPLFSCRPHSPAAVYGPVFSGPPGRFPLHSECVRKILFMAILDITLSAPRAARFFAPMLSLLPGAKHQRACPEISDRDWMLLGTARAGMTPESCGHSRASPGAPSVLERPLVLPKATLPIRESCGGRRLWQAARDGGAPRAT